MTPRSTPRPSRSGRLGLIGRLALLGALALGATACGQEAPLPDDGTQGLPLAGLGPELDDAGVEVISADAPLDATGDEVDAALAEAGFDRPTHTSASQAPESVVAAPAAGLVAVSGPSGGGPTVVVLVFAGPDAAAVFAAGDREVFADDAVDGSRVALLSGNVVGYAGPGKGQVTRLRRALEALAGPSTDPTADPSSTTSSATASASS